MDINKLFLIVLVSSFMAINAKTVTLNNPNTPMTIIFHKGWEGVRTEQIEAGANPQINLADDIDYVVAKSGDDMSERTPIEDAHTYLIILNNENVPPITITDITPIQPGVEQAAYEHGEVPELIE